MDNLNISKHVSILTVVLLMLPAASLRAESEARYEAVFVDGSRINGQTVFGWGEHQGSPRLDSTALLDAKRPLRWLRDRQGKVWSPSENDAYIEFVGGDRIVGRIEGFDAGDGLYVPAHLAVKPAAPLHQAVKGSLSRVRVLPGRIERVVFRSASRRRLQPGTLYYLNGRNVRFVQLRWRDESVVLLLKDGTGEVKIADISEIHLPRIDPWRAYYQELAVLSPACQSRMMRIETTEGLIATSSSFRFGASQYSSLPQQQAAASRFKQLASQLASIENQRKPNQLKLDQARANYHRQLAELDKQDKAAEQAYQKTVTETRRGIEALQKTNAAEKTKRQQQLDKEFQKARQAMQKRLNKTPAEKRDKMLKAFDAKQAQQRKSRERSLKKELTKLDSRAKRKQQDLEKFIRARKPDIQRRTRERKGKAAGAKRKLDQETTRWNAFAASAESARSRLTAARGSGGTWAHVVQPVWSLDPLWVPFRNIRMRWSFAPQRVPLGRVRPDSTVSPPFLGEHTNRSFAGGLLHSGGRFYAWGFAVHAYSELRFPLPRCANAFQSTIGLDGVVGAGGCVRARVHVGSSDGKPAYESPLLIGSKKTVDTGRVALGLRQEGPRRLILQADPADRDCPPGADPLNIRDKLDWLDSRLELDKAQLQDQVRRQIATLIARPGWSLRTEQGGDYAWTSQLDKKGKPGERRFWTMLKTGNRPLSLHREMTIGPSDKWLAVHLGLPTDENYKPDTVTLNVDGRRVQARKVPIKQIWRERPTPLIFSLAKYAGKKITLELTQPIGGQPLHWQAVRTSETLPPEYRLVEIMEFVGKGDMKVPYELGLALQSNRIAKTEKLAALEINQLGGAVNFRPSLTAKVPLDTLDNVLIGRDWTGGDKAFIKTFTTFKKMPSLKSLLVTEESGVSVGAIAKLRAEMPKLDISRIIIRLPSTDRGAHRPVTWRNHCKKEVTILWINSQGKLGFSVTRRIKPGEELKRSAFVGVRYEAHYPRKDYVNAQDYFFSQPLSSFLTAPDAVWDIKPGRT
jgi:hypothetical protein